MLLPHRPWPSVVSHKSMHMQPNSSVSPKGMPRRYRYEFNRDSGWFRLASAMLVCCVALAAQAADAGFLGLGVAVDGDGVPWNPTLKSAKVVKVVPRSPAEQAGVAVGDQIVEVAGRTVAGAKARELQPALQLAVGQRLSLVLKKASGELKAVSLMAAPKPE